jgi:hypothetical protein
MWEERSKVLTLGVAASVGHVLVAPLRTAGFTAEQHHNPADAADAIRQGGSQFAPGLELSSVGESHIKLPGSHTLSAGVR